MKENEVAFIQLSIDGNKKIHDFLRTSGDYTRVFKMAEYLEKNGIKVYISFTANKLNYKYFPIVARECYTWLCQASKEIVYRGMFIMLLGITWLFLCVWSCKA